jgi:hypothetical protein
MLDNEGFEANDTTVKDASRGCKGAYKWETRKTTSHGICMRETNPGRKRARE